MKIDKKSKKLKVALIVIIIIACAIIYRMPLIQSEIPLKEKTILYKYDHLLASGQKLEKEYIISLGLLKEQVPRGGEIDASFEMFMYLEKDKNYFKYFKRIIINYESNGVLVLSDTPSFYITKDEYEELKIILKEKNIEITPENLADYWRDINYFNRLDMKMNEERDFLYNMLTRWIYAVYYPDESVFTDMYLRMHKSGDEQSELNILIGRFLRSPNYEGIAGREELFRVTESAESDFIGAMLDNGKNLWVFYKSQLKIYNYSGDDIWSEEPTDKLPDKSVIPPDIVKAYKYIYNKEI